MATPTLRAAGPAGREPRGPTPAGPHAAAPTANLRKLANSLVVQHEGIYLDVIAPAGLNVGLIEISVSLAERVPGGPYLYSFSSQVYVFP